MRLWKMCLQRPFININWLGESNMTGKLIPEIRPGNWETTITIGFFFSLVVDTFNTSLSCDLWPWFGFKDSLFDKWIGAWPYKHLYTKSRILNWERDSIGIQWRSWNTEVIWSNFLVLVTSRAAVFMPLCSFFRQFIRQTIEQTIAIIKSWCDISMDCSFRWFICQISTVVGELPDLKKGFLAFMVNMGHHGVIGVHNNTQVSNSFWRRYTGPSDLNVVKMYRWAKFLAGYHHFSFRVIEFKHIIQVPTTDVINQNFHI